MEKFSRYKVEQLAVVKEANTLISLSNGQVSFHDLQSYELQETLTKTKGAATFAVTSNIVKDASTGIPSIVTRLAVAVKRRLLMWSWHDSELEPEVMEIALVTGIKSLTWATGTRVIAGLTSSYVLVDVETSAITDIVGPGSIGGAPGQDGGRFGGAGVAGMSYLGMSAPSPLATQLGGGEMLLARDINTLFIDTDAQSLGRRQIPWAFAPEAVGYSYPYLLALQSAKGMLEVRNPETLTLLQKIELPSAHQLHVPQPNVSLAHAGKGFLVLSDRCIWRMRALDYDLQIDTLVQAGRLDEALSLLGMLEDALLKDKTGSVRNIKMMKAQDLFDQKRYRDAIDLFSEISAPPEKVISLFPPFIAGDASASSPKHVASEHTQPDTGDGVDGKTSAEELPSNLSSNEGSTDGALHSNGDHEKGVILGKPTYFVSKTSLTFVEEGKDLKTATEELRGFLVSARTKMKKVLDPDGTVKADAMEILPTGEIGSLVAKRSFDASADQERLLETAKLVDTTLFRAYMFVSPSFAGPLFRIDNFCEPDVVKEKLIEAGRYNDLVDFFYGKKLHRQALELLQKFGESDDQNEATSQLAGPQRTVSYLQNLPPEMIELILQYAEWPLRKDPELGMEIFTADTENAETLPRQDVLRFLQRIDRNLAVRYLEHIIQELNDTTPDFHQKLVNIYIETLRAEVFTDNAERDKWQEKTLAFLKTGKYQPYKVLGLLPKDGRLSCFANIPRYSLILSQSQGCTKQEPSFLATWASTSKLWTSMFSNSKTHKKPKSGVLFNSPAFACYTDNRHRYCNQIYLNENLDTKQTAQAGRTPAVDPDDAPPSIYHTLLSLYLSPPPPHNPQWGPALNILAKHGARMPASSTLNLIPETLPIKELESYFQGRIRSANTIVNESRIVAGLRSTLAFSEESKLRLGDGEKAGRNRRVVVTEDRVCGVCYKRFGGSAIKVLPEYVRLISCFCRKTFANQQRL